jgi:hypothetical protein
MRGPAFLGPAERRIRAYQEMPDKNRSHRPSALLNPMTMSCARLSNGSRSLGGPLCMVCCRFAARCGARRSDVARRTYLTRQLSRRTI